MTKSALLSLEDSNKRLPLVRLIAREAMNSARTIERHQKELQELEAAITASEKHAQPSLVVSDEDVARVHLLNKLQETIQTEEQVVSRCIEELNQVGAQLVDPVSGLVEFPSTLDGQNISLSWQFDEPEVAHWRSPEDERSTRHPLQPSHQL